MPPIESLSRLFTSLLRAGIHYDLNSCSTRCGFVASTVEKQRPTCRTLPKQVITIKTNSSRPPMPQLHGSLLGPAFGSCLAFSCLLPSCLFSTPSSQYVDLFPLLPFSIHFMTTIFPRPRPFTTRIDSLLSTTDFFASFLSFSRFIASFSHLHRIVSSRPFLFRPPPWR